MSVRSSFGKQYECVYIGSSFILMLSICIWNKQWIRPAFSLLPNICFFKKKCRCSTAKESQHSSCLHVFPFQRLLKQHVTVMTIMRKNHSNKPVTQSDGKSRLTVFLWHQSHNSNNAHDIALDNIGRRENNSHLTYIGFTPTYLPYEHEQ